MKIVITVRPICTAGAAPKQNDCAWMQSFKETLYRLLESGILYESLSHELRASRWRTLPRFVMAVLVTAIHDFLRGKPDVDGRNKSGHDGDGRSNSPMTGRVLAWRRAHARHPRSHELPDRIRRIAELIEQIAGMFTQHGRMPLDGGTVVIEQHRIAGGAHGAEPWMLHLLRHAAGDDLGMIEHFPVIVHLRAG